MQILLYVPFWEATTKLCAMIAHWEQLCSHGEQLRVIYDGCSPLADHPEHIPFYHHTQHEGMVCSFRALRISSSSYCVIRQGVFPTKKEWERISVSFQKNDGIYLSTHVFYFF